MYVLAAAIYTHEAYYNIDHPSLHQHLVLGSAMSLWIQTHILHIENLETEEDPSHIVVQKLEGGLPPYIVTNIVLFCNNLGVKLVLSVER